MGTIGASATPRVSSRRVLAEPALFEEIEALALEQGACAVGYAEITPDLVFPNFVVPYTHAVVILSEMGRDALKSAPSKDAGNSTI